MAKNTKAARRYAISAIGALIAAVWASTAGTAGQARGPQRASLRAGVEARVEVPAAPQTQTGASVETPRRAGSVPDFTGIWVPTRRRGAPIVGGFARFNEQTGRLTLPSRTSNPVDFERDFGVAARAVPRERRPWYKPQHWERVQFSDVHGHSVKAPDPEFQCMPPGVPRAGMPEEIVQSDRHMVFVYGHHIRRIYLDGRPHPPEDQWLGTWWGHSVGRWEGDTLVISTVDFNGLEWLGWPGWITSPDKRVIERMRRVGETLTWEAEVTDSMLMQPWKTGPLTRQLNTDPEAEIEETLPCVERDLEHMVTRERG